MTAIRLTQLPREARDTLFMLAVIAWVILPMVPSLPLWCITMSALVLLWRGALAWQAQPLPARRWRLALLALALIGALTSFRTLFGRDAGVSLVVVLLSLKTLELHARRDAFVVFFLCFFLMLANFFYSQSLLTALAMLLALLGLLSALVNAHLPVGRPSLWLSARIAATMTALGLPVMLVLFLLFPRLAPLWGVPGDAMVGRSGLSSQMTVGSVARLALDSSVAFRVRFEGRAPPPAQMYFRGPVLSRFDGRRWQARLAGASPEHDAKRLTPLADPIAYEVTLEPTQQPWLLTLETTPHPPTLSGRRVHAGSARQWLLQQNITDLLRYQAVAYSHYLQGPLQAEPALQADQALPAGYNPRTLALARAWQRDATGPTAPDQWIDKALTLLRTGGYSYTLEPGLFGRDSADEFWFDRKAGFCEHIASSFVILMRALGVPARVVTGYQGAELNPLDRLWTVRQSDAHAWAEVWLAGQGWVRVDPTAAVSPARAGSLERLLSPQSNFANAVLGQFSPALGLRLRATWDALNSRWNEWVLNYSEHSQFNLLRSLGFSSPRWEDLLVLLCAVIVVISAASAIWAVWIRQQRPAWLRLWDRARAALARNGLDAGANSTPRQLATLLNASSGANTAAARAWIAWLLRLELVRYARASDDRSGEPRQTRAQIAQLARDLRRLPPPA